MPAENPQTPEKSPLGENWTVSRRYGGVQHLTRPSYGFTDGSATFTEVRNGLNSGIRAREAPAGFGLTVITCGRGLH